MLDMPRAPVGTTEGTHGEQTDSDETIPDGGRRYVRVRWQALSVTARLLHPLHRSREALLNPCIIHHHEDESWPDTVYQNRYFPTLGRSSHARNLHNLQIHGDSSTRDPVPDTHSRMDWQRRPCRLRRGS